MTIEFIAMAIVLVVMISFAIFMLHSLSVAAGIKIRADMKKLLQSYDNLIDEKSAEIESLLKKQEEISKEIARMRKKDDPVKTEIESDSISVGVQTIMPSVSYRSSGLGKSYETIKDVFRDTQKNRESIVDDIAKKEYVPYARGKTATKLLHTLNFDMVFALGQMSSDEQLSVLSKALQGDCLRLLDDFCNENHSFEVSEFWNWLKEVEEMESDYYSVLCGDKDLSEQFGLEYNEQICEGFQVKTGKRLYDYCIQEREIN